MTGCALVLALLVTATMPQLALGKSSPPTPTFDVAIVTSLPGRAHPLRLLSGLLASAATSNAFRSAGRITIVVNQHQNNNTRWQTNSLLTNLHEGGTGRTRVTFLPQDVDPSPVSGLIMALEPYLHGSTGSAHGLLVLEDSVVLSPYFEHIFGQAATKAFVKTNGAPFILNMFRPTQDVWFRPENDSKNKKTKKSRQSQANADVEVDSTDFEDFIRGQARSGELKHVEWQPNRPINLAPGSAESIVAHQALYLSPVCAAQMFALAKVGKLLDQSTANDARRSSVPLFLRDFLNRHKHISYFSILEVSAVQAVSLPHHALGIQQGQRQQQQPEDAIVFQRSALWHDVESFPELDSPEIW